MSRCELRVCGLPSADLAFIFDAMLARKSIRPSQERVTSDNSSRLCITLELLGWRLADLLSVRTQVSVE